MKWKNKAHEMDEVARGLLRNSEKFKHIYIFGAGVIGSRIMITMLEFGIFEGLIDNDMSKQKEGYEGFKVLSLNEYINIQDGFVVIAASERNIPVIKGQLQEAHLVEGADYAEYTEFNNKIFPIVSLYLYDKLFINIVQISLTERCSLKCKKCAHGCFAVDNRKAKDLTIEQVYKSVESFFDKVDFVYEFVLIGGEPLLYQQLTEAVQYICERYRKRIGVFSITTNGTIMPDKEILKLCREYNVLFRISNYSMAIPKLKEHYKRMVSLLDENGINYELGREEIEWMDYGFDYVERDADEDQLIKVFDACKTPCREVREDRYYFCVMARSVSENMGFHIGKNDYLDLGTLTGENYKKVLLEFNLGYSEKGYLDMCNRCHGAEAVKYLIPAAEQVEQ